MRPPHTRLARLFIAAPLSPAAAVELERDKSHYLSNVLRKHSGDLVRIFNGRDGEWLAELHQHKSSALTLICQQRLHPQIDYAPLLLFFSLIKRDHLDFLVQKATELGVTKFFPLITGRCNVREINLDRLVLVAREASEQSERLDVPEIAPPVQGLAQVLAASGRDYNLCVCTEHGSGETPGKAFAKMAAGLAPAILTGPEGGFTTEEHDMIKSTPGIVQLSMGSRILRADTAAIAALAAWQALHGEWTESHRKGLDT